MLTLKMCKLKYTVDILYKPDPIEKSYDTEWYTSNKFHYTCSSGKLEYQN